MSELSRRLMVTSSNITGIADQLERDGWLTRESVTGDRRATRLRLTPAGRKRFAAVAAVADVRIDHGDLTALLYLQGYTADEIRAG